MIRPVVASLVLVAVSLPVRAGVVLEFKNTSPGQAPTVSRAVAGADRLRIESEGHVLIWRGDKQVAWIVQSDGTYVEMTKEGIPGMADAMSQMNEQLAALPPDQRAMVEAMMKKQMGGAAPAGAQGAAQAPRAEPTTWTRAGGSDTVAGRACSGWEGMRSGRVEEIACATEWSSLGLSREDFAAFESLAEFMKGMQGPMAAQAPAPTVIEEGLPGIPLRHVRKSPGGDHVHEILRIEKTDVAASLFELPSGATAQDMGTMAPAGGSRRGR